MEIFKKMKTKKDDYEYKENPNLNAKNVWNSRISEFFWKYRAWQLLALISLLIAFVAVSGVIYIGSQSKFIPYIVDIPVTLWGRDVLTKMDLRLTNEYSP